jgi:hypothetical protein
METLCLSSTSALSESYFKQVYLILETLPIYDGGSADVGSMAGVTGAASAATLEA